MDVKIRIQELINCLDSNNDILLIDLLQLKLNDSLVNEQLKYSINSKDVLMASYGLKRTLSDFLFEQHYKYNKASKIMKLGNCENCPLAIVDKDFPQYKDMDKNNPVCVSCTKRYNTLSDYTENEYKKILELVQETLENNKELLECKALLNKLTIKNRKLLTKN